MTTSVRRKHDAYFTAARITQTLLERVDIRGMSFEPCDGTGMISGVMRSSGRTCFTNDINPDYESDFSLDATVPRSWDTFANYYGDFDWVATNPPFNQAIEILPLAYDHAVIGLAALLRLSWLEPTEKRAEWIESVSDNLAQVIIFGQPRPSFTDNGKTDSVTTCWCVWRHDWSWKALGIPCPFSFAYGWKTA